MANFSAGYFAAPASYLAFDTSETAQYFPSANVFLASETSEGAQYFSPSVVTVAANIRYWQRVYDTGTAGWCYYSTLNALNPTPASSATSPNWTGSISTPQVVAAVVVP